MRKHSLINFFTHWDLHVLFIAVVCALAGSTLGPAAMPLEFALRPLAFFMLFPEGMLLVGAFNERDEPRRLANYLISNQLAVLLIAICTFTARRLLFA